MKLQSAAENCTVGVSWAPQEGLLLASLGQCGGRRERVGKAEVLGEADSEGNRPKGATLIFRRGSNLDSAEFILLETKSAAEFSNGDNS